MLFYILDGKVHEGAMEYTNSTLEFMDHGPFVYKYVENHEASRDII